jgi:hypothetical protein
MEDEAKEKGAGVWLETVVPFASKTMAVGTKPRNDVKGGAHRPRKVGDKTISGAAEVLAIVGLY